MSDEKKPRGRPRINTDQEVAMDIYYVRSPAKLARKARRVGNGNLSSGFRAAMEEFDEEAFKEKEKKD